MSVEEGDLMKTWGGDRDVGRELEYCGQGGIWRREIQEVSGASEKTHKARSEKRGKIVNVQRKLLVTLRDYLNEQASQLIL